MILFLSTFSWAPHLEISGEIALKLKAERNRVHYHFIFNKNFDQGISFRGLVLSILRVYNLFKVLKKNGIGCSYSFDYFKSVGRDYNLYLLNEVQNYEYKGARIGLGVASTLNDLMNNNKIRKNQINDYANKIIPYSNSILDITIRQLEKHSPEVLYTFNTRFAASRPIYEGCKIKNIKISTYEAPLDWKKYTLSDKSIFDGYDVSKKIVKLWQDGNERKYSIGESFFKELRNTYFKGRIEEDERINEYILPNRLNLVYFPSSIHETYSLGELYPHKLFESADQALDFLIKYAHHQPKVNLVVRIHPIIEFKEIEEQEYWNKLFNIKHIKVVHWKDPISSYDLVKKADYSCVYHSTIGVEAAYMNYKTIVLGCPWWVGLKCVYSPSSIKELTDALDKGDVDYDYDFSDAVMYGYYSLEHGEPFEYFKPIDRFSGLLCGKNLNTLH